MPPRDPKLPAPFDWTSYAREIGQRVRTVREARGLTQENLAHAAGMSRNQVQNLERNRTSAPGQPANPTVETIFRIAWALDITPDALTPTLDGPPVEHYGATLDRAWPSIEIELRERVAAR